MNIFEKPPVDFRAKVEVSGTYCTWEEHLLLLKRHESRPEPYTWGVPAGKFENKENAVQAAIRELKEETSIQTHVSDLIPIKTLYIRTPFDFTFHMFHLKFKNKPLIHLPEGEITLFDWVPFSKVTSLNLITHGLEAFQHFNSYYNKN